MPLTYPFRSSRSLRHTRPLLLIALAGACGEPGADEPELLGSRQQVLISDQAHNAGTPGFFFLPPVVPRPARFGDFVPTASPSVRIERIDTAGNVLANVASFSRDASTRSELVRVHPKNGPADDGDTDPEGYFVVRWRTAQFNLSPDDTYRIRVSVPGRELGFADVDVVRNARELQRVDREQFAGVINGEVLRIKFRIDRPALEADEDGDGVPDSRDNCPRQPNPDQLDSLHNGIGDLCRCQSTICPAIDACHAGGECNGATGLCSTPIRPNGSACNDGNSCTAADSCTNGVCGGIDQCCNPGAGLSGSGAFPGMAGTLSFNLPPLAPAEVAKLALVSNPALHGMYFLEKAAMSPGQVGVTRGSLWGLVIQYGGGTNYAQIVAGTNAWLTNNIVGAGSGAVTLSAPADAASVPDFVFGLATFSGCGDQNALRVLVPAGGDEPLLDPE